jgi:hypothetical protein
MDLKSYLQEEINDSIESYKRAMTAQKKTLKRIKFLDVKHAEYTVYLHSLWENEGEKNTTTRAIGSLENAIKTAEEKFKKINGNRSDVQAKYRVDITIGKDKYSVPEPFWKKYTERKSTLN